MKRVFLFENNLILMLCQNLIQHLFFANIQIIFNFVRGIIGNCIALYIQESVWLLFLVLNLDNSSCKRNESYCLHLL